MNTHPPSPQAGRRIVDVAILGGGVAGSALALTLARDGFDVALVEREATFRDRIRGESIHPWGVRELTNLGLRDVVIDRAGGQELPRWTRYRDGQESESFAWAELFPGSPGEISVRHPRLQQALLDTAREAGVDVYRPATAEPRRANGRIGLTITTDRDSFDVTCRLLVGADGQRSALRTWIGGTGRRDPIHHAIGGAIVSGIDLAPDSAHQAYFDEGFVMIFPQVGGTNRLYYICPTEVAEAQQRAPQPETIMASVASVLPPGAIGEWTSAGPAGFFPNAEIVADRIHAESVVLIGDAAGSNDPSQGHGLSLVFRDIRELRTLLRESSDWSEVPAAYAAHRTAYFDVLHQHAHWSGPLVTESGPEADALRARVAAARAIDPTAGGFAAIFATGPDGLVADEAARRHFLGEDLTADQYST
ncbi:MAG: NAD(P)/FAD-dependent oxidoreductase [Thermomicrobiales bacterium]